MAEQPFQTFDVEVILFALGNNPGLARAIALAAMNGMPSLLDRFEDAVWQANWPDAVMAAHTLKGLGLQLGSQRFAARAKVLEEASRSGRGMDQDKIAGLRTDFADLSDAVHKWLETAGE